MGIKGFQVVAAGMQTSVQDRGYVGYLDEGICSSGAMDQYSLAVANILVGNERGEAGLEVTASGPTLLFLTDEIISITGADFSPKLDGADVEMYKALLVKRGQTLSLGTRKTGFRGYIAFAGGLDVPVFYGSRSTILRNEFGGFEGRALKRDDILSFRAPKVELPNFTRRKVAPKQMLHSDLTLRVIRGPQDYMFSEEAISILESPEGYLISDEFNRQGYRLNGPKIEPLETTMIVSDGVAIGSIQIPPSGEPFILLQESSSSGGYTKLGTVISVDIPKIAQTFAGSRLYFKYVTVDEAQELLAQEGEELHRLESELNKAQPPVRQQERTKQNSYRIMVNGVGVDISIERRR